ncbi:hypothetical protein H0H81_011190 [Sphagnurus paluster]|uniref:Uncharacterized protein n=1 Tax=Sphagnurus paluster TaxID=117069 RepID=A0A9P7FR53_9AGAR|nr:hypothetical protein H0H81_011190 [Sphagnurus paluster]
MATLNPNNPGPQRQPYETSPITKAAISLAYSSSFNPRGSENLWYGPYSHILTDMVSSFSGKFLVHPQSSLIIPSQTVNELKVRQEFRDEGVSYDFERLLDIKGLAAKRIKPMDKKLSTSSGWKEIKKLKGLKDKRDSVYDQELAVYDKRAYHADPNVSTETAEIEPAGDAINRAPDFAITHVGQLKLDTPKNRQEEVHFERRAGIKTYHSCCSLIVEIKPSRVRKGNPEPTVSGDSTHTMESGNFITQAQEDLMQYCAAHFLAYPQSKKVIALAAGGSRWKWAVIGPDDPPEFNWIDNRILGKRGAGIVGAGSVKESKFLAKFSPTFSLGTLHSDKQFEQIIKTLSQFLIDGHTPLPPLLDEDIIID